MMYPYQAVHAGRLIIFLSHLIGYPRGSFIVWAILYSNTGTRETITENTEDICCPALYEC